MTLACSGCLEVAASEPSMDMCTPLFLTGWLMGHVPLWTLCTGCETHGIWPIGNAGKMIKDRLSGGHGREGGILGRGGVEQAGVEKV